MNALSLITPPALEPVTLEEAKLHARVEGTREDALISGFIASARQYAESFTRRALVSQAWKLILDAFPAGERGLLELPRPPLLEVSSVKYLNTDGTEQEWNADAYEVVIEAGPNAERGFLYPKLGASYPTTQGAPAAVSVLFVAGYGATAADVPARLRQAVLQGVAELYRNRERADLGAAMDTTLWDFRSLRF